MRRILLALLLLLSTGARAADYVAAPGSTLGFRVSFQDSPTDIRFARFSPAIRFDPANPKDARFDVGIDLASVATGEPDGDTLVRGADFLAVARFPQARFQATRVRALGGNRFVADGVLSLRGVSKPVALAFQWTAGARPVLVGRATLRRSDFGITAGEFGSEIGEQVEVNTRLTLVPAPARKPAAPAPPAKAPTPAR